MSKFSSCCLHLILLTFVNVCCLGKLDTNYYPCHLNVNNNHHKSCDDYIPSTFDLRRRTTCHVIWISENNFAYYEWYHKTAYQSWIPVNPLNKVFIYCKLYPKKLNNGTDNRYIVNELVLQFSIMSIMLNFIFNNFLILSYAWYEVW